MTTISATCNGDLTSRYGLLCYEPQALLILRPRRRHVHDAYSFHREQRHLEPLQDSFRTITLLSKSGKYRFRLRECIDVYLFPFSTILAFRALNDGSIPGNRGARGCLVSHSDSEDNRRKTVADTESYVAKFFAVAFHEQRMIPTINCLVLLYSYC